MAINITIEDIKTWMASLPTLEEEDLGVESTAFILGLDKGVMVKIPVALIEGGEAPEEPSEPTGEPRGWWVHYDTKAKTYFDDTAAFISNGIMSQPTWIEDAEEIRLCAGITGFTANDGDGIGTVFNHETDVEFNREINTNRRLKVLDFGEANITTVPTAMIVPVGGQWGEAVFEELILNENVEVLQAYAIEGTWWIDVTVVIPGALQTTGENMLVGPFIRNKTPEDTCTFQVYAPDENHTALKTYLDLWYDEGTYVESDNGVYALHSLE